MATLANRVSGDIRPESDHGGKCLKEAIGRLSDGYVERLLLQEHKQEGITCWPLLGAVMLSFHNSSFP